MTNETGDLQFFGRQYLQRGIEAHDQIVIRVLVKYSNKRLPELRGCKAVGEDHMSTRGIGQALHFQQADLIQATSENIHDVAVMSSALCKIVVELG